ncbi:voltage-gated potassium channel [Alteromonadaceae bacterium 2753L.S.0a.02]|nr:voltage-gated potassium channel [Alteromonadaceae bacterium 2753L.S.0a.02]
MGLGGKLDWVIAALIIISVVGFAVETLPDIHPRTRFILATLEWLTVAAFTAEYVYRIYRAPNKWRFIFSFYGIIDLLAILPYLIAPAVDLRSIRLLRFLRFIRLLKLTRYNRALLHFALALNYAREEIVISITGTSVLVFLASVGIYYFEHPAQPEVYRSIFDALWWAVATFTTVGYGDIYPITTGGRLFTMGVLFLGLGLVAGTTGILASALMKVKNEQQDND